MDFLKKFNTETQYDADVENFEYATVSYIEDIEEVRYMKKYIPNYREQYLTFEMLEDGEIFCSNMCDNEMTLSYSLNDGKTWTNVNWTTNDEMITAIIPNLSTGDRVQVRGNLIEVSPEGSHCGCRIEPATLDFEDLSNSTPNRYNISGNPMSLYYWDDFQEIDEVWDNAFNGFFEGTLVVSAENLYIGFSTLATQCYEYMFRGCTSLTTAPELPATTLANRCYFGMFDGCTSLTTAPELPATTLEGGCYRSMFNGCTSLTTAPGLPATTLEAECYYEMFNGCTSLTTAPELPATTLEGSCYRSMFNGCTALTSAPVLPATTLTNYCYQYMFQNCTSLTTAPELPATTLVQYCYQYMFSGCSNLNYIKAMFTTTPSATYTYNWVSGVAASGTFVKNSAATWDVTDTYGVPTGWTIETASE